MRFRFSVAWSGSGWSAKSFSRSFARRKGLSASDVASGFLSVFRQSRNADASSPRYFLRVLWRSPEMTIEAIQRRREASSMLEEPEARKEAFRDAAALPRSLCEGSCFTLFSTKSRNVSIQDVCCQEVNFCRCGKWSGNPSTFLFPLPPG